MKTSHPEYCLFLVFIFLVFLFAGCKDPIDYLNKNKAEVVLINRAGEPLVSGTLSISNHTPAVKVGRIENDSTGYVTNGMNFKEDLILIKMGDSLALVL